MTSATKKSSRTGSHFGGPIFVIAVCSAALWVIAGQLDPPPGPIMPTNRVQLNQQAITLPYTISEPGSYVLTSNLTGTPGNDGIIIDADTVTLDLNGFALIGGKGTGNGIVVTGFRQNLAVRSGVIVGWSSSGVDAASASNSLFENLRTRGNTVDGLRAGSDAVVKNCEAQLNGRFGIFTNIGCTLFGCTASENGDTGVQTQRSLITSCTADQNSNIGIAAQDSSTVTDCSATTNGGHGIALQTGSNVTGCTAARNRNGIHTLGSCRIVSNLVVGNTSAGIRVKGTGNRIENNTARDNLEVGLDILTGGNLVIRNSATTNPQSFSIAPGNTVGPIVTGTGTITSSNPWANFEF